MKFMLIASNTLTNRDFMCKIYTKRSYFGAIPESLRDGFIDHENGNHVWDYVGIHFKGYFLSYLAMKSQLEPKGALVMKGWK
jgi:hypothetical protein